MKIAHIINPVKVGEASDLYIAQPITFETMRRAERKAEEIGLEVELYFTCFEEDLDMAPEGFQPAQMLTRSVMDVGTFQKQRKLPLVKDILDRLNEASDADYFIYTNVDIAVKPDFYIEVKRKIEAGYDAFVINRRTISKVHTSVSEIDAMYAEEGEKHPGYDCFVFKKEAYKQYTLGDTCIGANWIGRVLISNLIIHSENFHVFEDEYLTFHIGDDRSWKIDAFSDFDRHNETVLQHVLSAWIEAGRDAGEPLIALFATQHNLHEFMVSGIRKQNTVRLKLPAEEATVYGSDFKPSWHWEERVLLRQDPVFVVGYPRSGTTLVQSLLATQEEVLTLPETHFFTLVRDSLAVEKGKITYQSFTKAVNVLREKIRFSVNAERHLAQLCKENKLSPKMFFEAIVTDNLIDTVDGLEALRRKRWIEKTPDHVLKINVIKNFYPDAKYIFVLRSPEQAILSRRKNFRNEAGLDIRVHAKRWMESVGAIEAFKKEYPKKVKIIKLEALTANKEDTVAALCDFIGIGFDSARLADHKKVAEKLIPSWEHWKKDVIKSEVSGTIADNKKELDAEDLIRFLKITKPKLEEYGYMNERYKNALEAYTQKKNFASRAAVEMDSLMAAFDELTSVSVFKHPVKKFQAYKKMLSTYHNIKGE